MIRMSMFIEIPLATAKEEEHDIHLLTFDLTGTPLTHTYTIPNQYVTVHINNKNEFFALASAPIAKEHIDILVKQSTNITGTLFEIAPNDRISISPPTRKGFPLEEIREHD